MRDIKFRAWDKTRQKMLTRDFEFKILPVSGAAIHMSACKGRLEQLKVESYNNQ